ncbi:hypothetical protein RI030_15275 [Aphanizomenon flos-aquae NRERC-008]|jgi:hypothetical protein|uniref:UPF0367 protein AN484_23805 n=3 Tax=Aphanizomenon flos-aquae TaxID=1176 RepID=A0A1B7WP96_APHFL|nr:MULTISPECIES: hypothetical protein [Aphanizomenon]MBD1217889.1 hypothetical protein [Aphanizomenon flos-aquae Clear-A1]MBO1042565.1 hypothetical protein [Aphanizomenon flos-aquae UKL13-PB]MBO1062385.1 hypothetical protein [Aphanizomenon flos-aquae CP01]MCE2903684.1 hypothetical protein [Anabaena sp. CoA2_C59]MDJ0506374.1 hypothetical protein [Nostocales cyanobacterium LE14-WE12]OBQ17046.1 MAG: hypothetical protein AN488_19185 [Anabaena sp. WA113]OBQ23455.1 MAG: hypothetical protein AN481_
MFTIDLSIRNTAFPISVQRKSTEDAEAVYQLILAAMRTGNPDIIELKCEGKAEKKIAVRASEISGIQIIQKDSAASSSGKPPGFAAFTAE